ncbi:MULTISPECIES: hypothetical protein [Streptomyces]|uniref:Cardiolipin synthase N-terminal domain-containing protein n=2 Tax=Streptomyces TaxID=1883 RepID=A0ABV9IQT7_9ACTN
MYSGATNALLIVVIGLAMLIVAFSFIDCVRTPSERIRFVPKLLWLYFMVQAPLFGSLVWTYFGKSPEPADPREAIPGMTKGPVHRTEPLV